MTEKTLLITVGSLLIIVIGVFTFLQIHRQKWLGLHCQEIGKVSSSVGTSIVMVDGKAGFGSFYIPEKTGYKCDNSKEYWE